MLQGDPAKPTEAWLTIGRDRAEHLLETLLTGRVNAPGQRAKEWLEDLLEHHLLQVAADPREIEFHHQLFQEYYAAEHLLNLLPELSDEQLKRDYLNLLKWTEAIALMLALVSDEAHALRVVRLALDIDLRLGSRLAGEASLDLQEATVGEVIAISVADWLKVELLGETQSGVANPELLFFLTHPNINIAKVAASYTGETHNQATIDILIKRLDEISSKFFTQKSWGGSDKTGILWSTHAQALSYISPQVATKFLREKLEEHGALLLMTTQAAQILMQLDAENVIPELLEEFWNAQHEENRKLAAGLEESEKEIQIPDSINSLSQVDAEILKSLKNTRFTPPSYEWRQRNYILNLLENSSEHELFIADLIQAFDQEPDESLQRQIIQILGKSKHGAAIRFLVKKLSEDSISLRTEAAKQLIKLKSIGNPEDLEELRRLSKYGDWNISWCATIVLGHLRDSTILPRMIDELESHQTPSIRSTAARILGIIGNSNCVPSLLKAINSDSDRYVRINAACSLSYFEQKEAIPILLDSLKAPTNADPHPEIMISLSRFSLKEPLLEIIQSKNLYWQRAAIELGKLAKSQGFGESEILPILFKALEDPGHESSSEVIDLLSELADSETLNNLVDALEHPEKYTKDIYFPNRVTLVLVRCPSETIADKLSALRDLYKSCHIPQLSWLIPTIQSRCKFYNHEIWQEAVIIQSAKLEVQKLREGNASRQVINQFPNATEVKVFERVEHYHEHPPDSNP
jgi:HEAT repeat protein